MAMQPEQQSSAPPQRGCNTPFLWSAILIAVLAFSCLVFLLLPSVSSRPASPRTQCRNSLKQIGLALQNYHDTYGSFPPAYIADANGKPMHSWRVLILPFMDLPGVYRQYRFDEPWDSPHNLQLVERFTGDVFHCPSDSAPGRFTNYVAVVGQKTAWPGATSLALSQIADGPANTILLVEYSGGDILWTEPRDLDYSSMPLMLNPARGAGVSSAHRVRAHVLMSDGSAHYLDNSTDPEQLRRMLERDDGEPLEEF